ncbi:FAD-dependent monooxygenase [Paractinoplanes atraurantiacus]|uniref:2-polyprenyl-6-methoxyphenol hydroxylase n=1 Tax=Paractinoplanes atraurantiacus TaxID=1036182 RepID=A0A285HYF6_9ACTN|nr:FAD-dependent monooxygenase [Actinoplanes atraurantiacus]SNY40768.1 2-polyprenyl-6-methoxyphenol hydroxylase [Actinoplanes atraurantiacus]
MPTAAFRTPVLVAGAGVTGSLTALELAHHGVPSMVVERSGGPPRILEPLLVNGRNMELLRRLGLAGDLRPAGVDPDGPVDVVWARGVDQEPLLVWRLPSVTELRGSYAASADGSAPIEPYLLIAGSRLAGRLRRALEHPLIDLRSRWTLTDLRTEAECVVATVIDAESGKRHVIEAAYLAGCDGAGSTVRRCAGLEMEDLGSAATYLTVAFRSAGLAARWPHPSAVITGGSTVLTGHDGDLCVAHLPLTEGDEAAVADPAGLLTQRLGLPGEPPEICAVAQRAGTPSVARSYRRGRVFLAGQAAHRAEPPGNDVDTCIGDAVDLGWRLAAAVHGWAGEHLLAGYEAERRRQALLDRELGRRAGQTRSRFQRLVASGADREVLVEILRQEAPQVDPAGTGPAGMSGAPGFRPPAFRLAGGEQFFDRLGPQLTLVDLTDDQGGWPLVTAARARGVPMRHLPMAGAPMPAAWCGRLVLIRPDQQVAWRADGPPPDCDGVLDEVTGVRHQLYENA